MIEFFSEYGLFLAKAVTVVIAVLVIAGGIVAISIRSQHKQKEQIEVNHLNQRYEHMALSLQSAILPKKAFKKTLKAHKKADKDAAKKGERKQRKIFVINFHGDIRATAVAALREEITAILTVAEAGDEVLLRLESAGGLVHAYGLAASQLTRICERGLKLTAAVDKVAASGGYLMACVADKIIAAPFAIVGSIGVLAQIPNFHRLLKKNEIDFEQFMAGRYKRTVTMFGENTEQDREKFQQELEETHQLFMDFVRQHRSKVNVEQVATGEHWYGSQALTLNLVDELRTSDDYLLTGREQADLFEVIYRAKKPLIQRLLSSTQEALRQQHSEWLPLSRERLF